MLQFGTSSAVNGQAFTRRCVPALLVLVTAVAVALTLPAAASAAAPPNAADRQKARSSCANERGLTRARHQRFRLKYGRRAFSRCVRIKARAFARRRASSGLGGGLGGLPAAPALPGVPTLPTVPGMPGVIEMPGVRLECQVAQMEDPIGFMQEYPGANPIEMCVMMESMP
jgi:hypothetical protein